MSANENVVVGGLPHADLLPAEIKAEHTHRTVRKRVLIGLAATVVVTVLVVGGTFALQMYSAAQLVVAQSRTTELLLEQQKYSEVREVQDALADVKAGQRVGAATEVDWKAYMDTVVKTLPDDVIIRDLQVDAASPLVDYSQADVPLRGQRIAELTFTAETPTVPDVSAWLTGLATLTGYTDASPDTTTIDDETGTYSTVITMHINEDAWSQRFSADDEEK